MSQQPYWQCPRCRKLVHADSRFCHVCGFTLVHTPGAASPAPARPKRTGPRWALLLLLFIPLIGGMAAVSRLAPQAFAGLGGPTQLEVVWVQSGLTSSGTIFNRSSSPVEINRAYFIRPVRLSDARGFDKGTGEVEVQVRWHKEQRVEISGPDVMVSLPVKSLSVPANGREAFSVELIVPRMPSGLVLTGPDGATIRYREHILEPEGP